MSSKRNIKVYDPTYKEHKPLFVGGKKWRKREKNNFFFQYAKFIKYKKGKNKTSYNQKDNTNVVVNMI